MKLILLNQTKLTKLELPRKIEGSFWVVDELNKNANIVNVEAEGNNWILKENSDAKIIFNGSYVPSLKLESNISCIIEYNDKKMLLNVEKKYNKEINYYIVNPNQKIVLGKNSGDIT